MGTCGPQAVVKGLTGQDRLALAHESVNGLGERLGSHLSHKASHGLWCRIEAMRKGIATRSGN
jgi:hypothetical protein